VLYRVATRENVLGSPAPFLAGCAAAGGAAAAPRPSAAAEAEAEAEAGVGGARAGAAAPLFLGSLSRLPLVDYDPLALSTGVRVRAALARARPHS
jgi:hypothetical protein